MARGKVQVRRIENPVHRQITFCKRRAGLLKKAKELSVLCDADVGLIVFSSLGKLYDLATTGNMQELIERYLETVGASQRKYSEIRKTQQAEQEISKLRKEIELLKKGMRCMLNGATGNMTLEDLHALERQLEIWIYHIRSAKMQNMIEEIQILKNKEGILKAANDILQEKMVEQNTVQIVGQNELFNATGMIEDVPYPQTIMDGIFQF